MHDEQKKWFYLIGLSIIWGSSFILIKKGLVGLSAYQLGALRMLLTALFLFLYGFKSIFEIPRDKWKWIVVTALLSTFFPVFFFALAETKIDSAVVSVLNSLVPLFALIIGGVFFRGGVLRQQLFGVIVGLVGTLILILHGATISGGQDYRYSILVILASMGYASNVNILKYHLKDVSALAISVGNFVVLLIPSILILYFTSFFTKATLSDSTVRVSMLYIAILALFGTAIAKVLFNKLIKISNPVFSASVTYLIPIIAVLWGLIDGERFAFIQVVGAATILGGVYLVNRK